MHTIRAASEGLASAPPLREAVKTRRPKTKVDTYLTGEPADAELVATRARAAGYDGVWSSEVRHDPFLPLGRAATVPAPLELGTSIVVAFARNPMTLASTAWDLQALSGGRFLLGLGSQVRAHIERRFSMPWSHPADRMREFILALRAIWASWQHGTRLDFQGELLPAHPDDAGLRPGPADLRTAQGAAGRGRHGYDARGGRSGRQPAGTRVHHAELPGPGHPAHPGRGPGQSGRRGRTFR